MATAVLLTRVASDPDLPSISNSSRGLYGPSNYCRLGKFFHLLVNWDMYLAPAIARLSPIPGHTLMLIVGVIEVVAGILAAIKPRIGAYVVAAWLWESSSISCWSPAITMWPCVTSGFRWDR